MIETDDVVLDMDGVLADFEGYFCKKFGYEHRELAKLDDRYPDKYAEIIDFVKDPTTYSRLNIIYLGRQIAKWLDKNDFVIHIVSSRPASAYSFTQHWLNRAGIPFHSLHVDDSVDKTKIIAKIKPAFAIDDLGTVAEKLAKYDIPVLLISQPWNASFRKKYPRIKNFSAFLHQFKRVSEGSAYGLRNQEACDI